MTAKEATEKIYYDCWTNPRFGKLMQEFDEETKLLQINIELNNGSAGGPTAFFGVDAIVTLDGIENEAGD